jgi:hypothetical protein
VEVKNFWIQKHCTALHKLLLEALRRHMFAPVDDLETFLRQQFPNYRISVTSSGKSWRIVVGPVEAKILIQ